MIMLGQESNSSIWVELIRGFGKLIKYIVSKVWSYSENF